MAVHHAHDSGLTCRFVFFCTQDVGTVCRTAAGTSPLLVSLMGIQPTCTASGEYQSRQERRYEHSESARPTRRCL